MKVISLPSLVVKDGVEGPTINSIAQLHHPSLGKVSLIFHVLVVSILVSILCSPMLVQVSCVATPISLLTAKRDYRVYKKKHMSMVGGVMQDLSRQQYLMEVQKHAVLMSSKVRANSYVSQRIQYLSSTIKDSNLISNLTKIFMNKNYQDKTNTVSGIQAYLNTSSVAAPINGSLFTGSKSYMYNTISTFKSTMYPAKERNFMCTGDYFGIYIHPINGSLMQFGSMLGKQTGNPVAVSLSIASDEYYIQLACGMEHALVLTNKAIYGWGYNEFGQVGDKTFVNVSSPTSIISHSNTINFINAGPYNSVYLDTSGRTYVWGRGSEAQLGNGGLSKVNYPIIIGGTFSKVCFGKHHTIGISRDGYIYYWGQRIGPDGADRYVLPTETYTYTYNYYGQVISATLVRVYTPTYYSYSYPSPIVDIQCGDYTTMFLQTDGKLYGWGQNDYGVLGNSAGSSTTVQPVQLSILGSYKIAKFFHRTDYVYAISTLGIVYAWGRNDNTACQCATNVLNHAYACYRWGCYYDCGTYSTPAVVEYPKDVESIHDIYLMREGSLILYSHGSVFGMYGGGYFKTPIFENGYEGMRNYFSKVMDFPSNSLYFMPIQQKRSVVFESQSTLYITGESSYLSTSPVTMDTVVLNKNKMDSGVTITNSPNYYAYSFYSTHHLMIGGVSYYFGGFVNNTISGRIISKTSWNSVTELPAVLPYEVAGGMLTLVDDYVYIFGGLTNDTKTDSIIATNKIMRANMTDLLHWEVIEQTIPSNIYNGISLVVNDIVYIFGGRYDKRNSSSQDILSASVDDMVFTNTNKILPYLFSETNIFSDDNYIYMMGGYDDKQKPIVSVVRANKKTLHTWEETDQKLRTDTLGNTNVFVTGTGSLYLLSFNSPQQVTTQNMYTTFNSIKILFAASKSTITTLESFDGALINGDGLKNCLEYKNNYGSAAVTGYYWVKPLSTGSKIKIYCDQVNNGGGWGLVATKASTGSDSIISELVPPTYTGLSLSDIKYTVLKSVSTSYMIMGSTFNVVTTTSIGQGQTLQQILSYSSGSSYGVYLK